MVFTIEPSSVRLQAINGFLYYKERNEYTLAYDKEQGSLHIQTFDVIIKQLFMDLTTEYFTCRL